MLKISPETRISNFNLPARKLSILGESRKVTRVRGAGWEVRFLSSRLTSTAVLRANHFHDNFVRLWNLNAFRGLQALLITDTIFSLQFWPRKVWNSFQQDPEAEREFVKITRSHLNLNCWCYFPYWPAPFQSSYFIGPYNMHSLLFSGIEALLCHHP